MLHPFEPAAASLGRPKLLHPLTTSQTNQLSASSFDQLSGPSFDPTSPHPLSAVQTNHSVESQITWRVLLLLRRLFHLAFPTPPPLGVSCSSAKSLSMSCSSSSGASCVLLLLRCLLCPAPPPAPRSAKCRDQAAQFCSQVSLLTGSFALFSPTTDRRGVCVCVYNTERERV